MAFPESRILTTQKMIQIIQESDSNNQRFCFILGSGASVDSKIPAGNRLEMIWMDQLMGKTEISPGQYIDPEDTRKLAQHLYDEDEITHSFDLIEKAWENSTKRASELRKEKGSNEPIEPTLSSEYYFDLYKLRFHPNPRNGYRYLERIMENKEPSLGYHALALILAKTNQHNLVITTNFDSLVEDALFLYTIKKPLVVGHEALAAYIDSDIQRPIIAKVHRGLMFEPFNSPETTDHLEAEWKDALDYALKTYTPIVIGYGGGDGSLMNYLRESTLTKGIYWCYLNEYGLPNKDIQKFVRQKNGCFVTINGFDAFMTELGLALFESELTPFETRHYMDNQSSRRIADYIERWTKLKNKPNNGNLQILMEQAEQSTFSTYEDASYDTYWYYFNRGYLAHESKQYEIAIQEYSLAIERDPSLPITYYNRACCHSELKHYNDALRDYDRAIALDPNDAMSYSNRANVYLDIKEFEQAILDYSIAVALDSNNSLIYYNRGCLYDELKDYQLAIQNYDKAIDIEPDNSSFYNNRGNSFSNLKLYNHAIQDYTKAISLDPTNIDHYINRGITYDDLQDYHRAINDYNTAISLNPQCASALNCRAFTYAHLGEYKKALSDVDMALLLDPNDPNALHTYGFIYLQQENYPQAIEYFTKALSFDDKLKDAYEDRAKAYRAIGETALAEADEAKAAELEAEEEKNNP